MLNYSSLWKFMEMGVVEDEDELELESEVMRE